MNKFIILSENSSDHWPYFYVKNHNVLDIGCGRWFTEERNELSPFYFGQTANLVVGVDSNLNDISYYIEETKNNNKYIFERIIINSGNQIKNLINKYNITALKCDIEGHEECLCELSYQDMQSISEIAIEYHNHDLRIKIIKKLIEWNFNLKIDAKFATAPDHMGVLYANRIV